MPTHYAGSGEERLALDVYIKLMRAAGAVAARTSAPMVRAGLSTLHFGVLETLYHLGPLRISELARKHLKSRNNFTVVIDNMEREGLVRRERDGGDRRSVRVHLTDAGRDRVLPLLPLFVSAVMEDFQALSTDELRTLSDLLRRLGRRDEPPAR